MGNLEQLLIDRIAELEIYLQKTDISCRVLVERTFELNKAMLKIAKGEL